METEHNAKFAKIRVQLGVKSVDPTVDIQSEIAQTWDDVRKKIDCEKASFDSKWESYTSKDDCKSALSALLSDSYNNKEQVAKSVSQEITGTEHAIATENELLFEEFDNDNSDNNDLGYSNNLNDNASNAPAPVNSTLSSENLPKLQPIVSAGDALSQETELINSQTPIDNADSAIDEVLENPKAELSEESPELVLGMLQEVMENLTDKLEESTNPSTESCIVPSITSSSVDKEPLLTSLDSTAKKSLMSQNANRSKTGKHTFRKVSILLSIVLIFVAFFACKLYPTYQLNQLAGNVSGLSVKLQQVSRNYHTGITTIGSISVFNSENQPIVETGETTISGFPLFPTDQCCLESISVEGIRFFPQSEKEYDKTVHVAESFSSPLFTDNNPLSGSAVASGETSRHLFAQYTNTYVNNLLDNMEYLFTWLPEDFGKSLEKTTNSSPQFTVPERQISINKIHLTGETMFMGKQTVFSVDIDNYSTVPDNGQMLIKITFGTDCSTELVINATRRDNGTEMNIQYRDSEMVNACEFGHANGLRLFQNNTNNHACQLTHTVDLSVSHGQVKGEMTITQNVSNPSLEFQSITESEDVNKLQMLVTDLDTIIINDKFEGLSSKPVHCIESNIDSLGQSILEIVMSSSQNKTTQTPNENTETVSESEPDSQSESDTQTETIVAEKDNNPDSSAEPSQNQELTLTKPLTPEVVTKEQDGELATTEKKDSEQFLESEKSDVELDIIDNTVPLVAPNSPVIGNNDEGASQQTEKSCPPPPIFVNDEPEENTVVKSDEPVVRFTLRGKTKIQKQEEPGLLPE